jgi:signal transduction histidine kinase
LNGIFEVQSANNAGTTIEISLPYEQKELQRA